MDNLIPVVIILVVVCFIGYKNRDKISALYDKVQNDRLDDEPEVSTIKPEIVTPYKVEPAVEVVEAPIEVSVEKVVRSKAITLPKKWTGERLQLPCNFKGGVKYTCEMTVAGVVATTSSVNDPARTAAKFTVSHNGNPCLSRGVNNNWRLQAGTLEITADRDCQVQLMMVKK